MKEIWLERKQGVELVENEIEGFFFKKNPKVAFVSVKTAEDQEKVIGESRIKEYVFVDFKDWTVIPLENIIARKGRAKIIVKLNSPEQSSVVLGALEKGADGVLLTDKENLDLVKDLIGKSEKIEIKQATVQDVTILPYLGHRVCIDTFSVLQENKGILLGNFSGVFFLVASESEESEFVKSRPFRVNSGSVAHYLKVGDKTRYLSELQSGDEIEIADIAGNMEKSHISRVKIERRQMVMIRAAECEGGKIGTIILQNAETVKLFGPDGKRISVMSLKAGDKILVHSPNLQEARHFGTKIEETIIER